MLLNAQFHSHNVNKLLSVMASQSWSYKEASADHQAVIVISPLNASGASTSQAQFSNNFPGNPFWYPPDMSHSVFSAHIID